MNKIPSVNLLDFLSNNPEDKQRFVEQIGRAYETIGFVALKGHFLEDKLVDNLYSEVKRFFDLTTEQKQTMKSLALVDNGDMYHLERKVPKAKKKGI